MNFFKVIPIPKNKSMIHEKSFLDQAARPECRRSWRIEGCLRRRYGLLQIYKNFMLGFIFSYIIFITCSPIYSLAVGSDSACSRQNLVTFPQADSDNEMNGFALFEAGFTLASQSTTCTFDSFYPVSWGRFIYQKIYCLMAELVW